MIFRTYHHPGCYNLMYLWRVLSSTTCDFFWHLNFNDNIIYNILPLVMWLFNIYNIPLTSENQELRSERPHLHCLNLSILTRWNHVPPICCFVLRHTPASCFQVRLPFSCRWIFYLCGCRFWEESALLNSGQQRGGSGGTADGRAAWWSLQETARGVGAYRPDGLPAVPSPKAALMIF